MGEDHRRWGHGSFHSHRLISELVTVTVTITDKAGNVRAVRSGETTVRACDHDGEDDE